jgi:hypothetical protein
VKAQSHLPTVTILEGVFALCLFFLATYFYKFHSGLSSKQSDWGDFGSYFAGTVGMVFSFATVYLMYLTFREQRRSSFENRFQSMLNNYYSMLNLVKENFKHNSLVNYQTGREIFGNAVQEIDVSDTEESFRKIFNMHINVFSHHANYILGVFDVIFGNVELTLKEQDEYAGRLISQISVFEIVFFAYYFHFMYTMNNSSLAPNFVRVRNVLYHQISQFKGSTEHSSQIAAILNLLKDK